jgi:hypothetical protein
MSIRKEKILMTIFYISFFIFTLVILGLIK